jgi:hypothetical protein
VLSPIGEISLSHVAKLAAYRKFVWFSTPTTMGQSFIMTLYIYWTYLLKVSGHVLFAILFAIWKKIANPLNLIATFSFIKTESTLSCIESLRHRAVGYNLSTSSQISFNT